MEKGLRRYWILGENVNSCQENEAILREGIGTLARRDEEQVSQDLERLDGNERSYSLSALPWFPTGKKFT